MRESLEEEIAKIRQERDEKIAELDRTHKKEVTLLFLITAIVLASIVYFGWFY
jgi:hypothetical protein